MFWTAGRHLRNIKVKPWRARRLHLILLRSCKERVRQGHRQPHQAERASVDKVEDRGLQVEGVSRQCDGIVHHHTFFTVCYPPAWSVTEEVLQKSRNIRGLEDRVVGRSFGRIRIGISLYAGITCRDRSF